MNNPDWEEDKFWLKVGAALLIYGLLLGLWIDYQQSNSSTQQKTSPPPPKVPITLQQPSTEVEPDLNLNEMERSSYGTIGSQTQQLSPGAQTLTFSLLFTIQVGEYTVSYSTDINGRRINEQWYDPDGNPIEPPPAIREQFEQQLAD